MRYSGLYRLWKTELFVCAAGERKAPNPTGKDIVILGIHKRTCVLGAFLAFAADPSARVGGRSQENPAPKAQVETRRAETAEAVRLEHGPKLDGTLGDPLWQSAKPISDFRQQEPYEGQPATE
jgi:hypothetical protein